MIRKALVVIAVSMCAAMAVCYAAQDVLIGTWKLNASKSKIAPGQANNSTVAYSMSGDSVKVVIDGTDGAGKPIHQEWTGKYDGKDYPVTGSDTADTRAYTRLSSRSFTVREKKGGKVVNTVHVVVSPDGKTRTVTSNGTDPSGKKFASTAVYDKQ
jgi:hypothetical protein